MRKIALTFLMILVSASIAFGASTKISELTETQTLTDDDLFLVSTYLTGSYTSKYITTQYVKSALGVMTIANDTLWDAAGDLVYGTGANTGARLAIGAPYALLMTNAGATAPAWTYTLGAPGTPLTKIWATDLELTNAPTIGGADALTALGGQASDSALTTLSSKTFSKTALTGTGGLDTILYDDLADGDIGMVGTSAGIIYWYVFEDSSSAAESSPSVIAPDDVGVNTGRWLLKLYCDGSSCSVPQAATGSATNWLEGSANGTDYMRMAADDDVGTNRKVTLSSSVTNSEDLSIQLGANDNTVTFGSSTSADSIIGLNSYSLGSAGVKLTGDGDGAITFLGLGNGYDEDLTLNLDDTENTASISSSTGVTSISLGSIGMVTTGTLQGAIKVNTDANGMSSAEMTTAGVYGAFYVASGAGTWNLPAVASGMNICIYSTTAAAIVVNPDDGDVITLNGTALSAGDSITSASGAGDFICLIGVSDSSWLTLGRSGTWTDTN